MQSTIHNLEKCTTNVINRKKRKEKERKKKLN